MTTRMKRTYNLDAETVARVRDLAGRADTAPSQDGVVELAIERLYQDIRDKEEARLWANASEDTAFRAEMRDIASRFRDRGSWPE